MADPAPERWQEIKQLFAELYEAAPEERARRLGELERRDAALAEEVRSLLDSANRGEAMLERVLAAEARSFLADTEPAVAPGTRLGPWAIERLIGTGGMGAVFLARRADAEYETRVAIKLVRPGLFSEEALSRLRAERQALAILNHPNVARLIDGGSTPEGVPYLVMEYVEGVPIDAWCAARSLPVEERLRLFRVICAAVSHAHRNLIVHRDIKPGNVLVTESGEVKLLDFGIAKLLGPEAADAGLTRTGERVLTPEYASPEQVRGEPISTASDVYSLGVLLYRLLTDRPPYRLPTDRPAEIERVICEQPPERPSTAVLRRSDGAPAEPARQRVSRRLRGDLDNIVLKALRKEPSRRYGTVDELSEDVRRHLEGLPVSARPETFRYLAGRFVRRHRVGVGATAVVVAALVGGSLVALDQARRARREARKAERIHAFLQEVFGAAHPSSEGKDVTVAEVLEGASRRAGLDLAREPEVEAAARETIGSTYVGLGLYDAAERELTRSLSLRRALYGSDHPDTASVLGLLAQARENRGELDSAEKTYREALAMRERVHPAGDTRIAKAWNDLGGVLLAKGDLDAAERAHRRALAVYRGAGEENWGLAETLNDLAVVLGTKGDRPGAIVLHREALAITRRIRGERHPDVAMATSTLAGILGERPDGYAEAEALFARALAMRRELLGPEHPDVAWTLYNYAYLMLDKKDYPAAERLAREVLALRGKAVPEKSPILPATMQVMARARMEQGDPASAEPLLRESLALRRAALPPGHWLLDTGESVLGDCLARLGRRQEAEVLLTRSHAALREKLGEAHIRTRDAAERLAKLKSTT